MSTASSMSPPRTIQSVDRAIAIVRALADNPSGLRLSVLATQVGLRIQTTQSLVRTLQWHRWVDQAQAGGLYTLGPGVHDLATRFVQKLDIAAVARPIVAELCNRVGEYILLATFQRGRLSRLTEAHPKRGLVVASGVETSERLHTMATARVLLADLTPEALAAVVATMTFEPAGPRAITSAEEFVRQVNVTRRRGYSLCIEEAAEDCAAMAVPVKGQGAKVVAALGAAVPLVRLHRHRRELLAALMETAARISVAWGQGGSDVAP